MVPYIRIPSTLAAKSIRTSRKSLISIRDYVFSPLVLSRNNQFNSNIFVIRAKLHTHFSCRRYIHLLIFSPYLVNFITLRIYSKCSS